MCKIPCGRYTPKQLCCHMEEEMTETVQVIVRVCRTLYNMSTTDFPFRANGIVGTDVFPCQIRTLFPSPHECRCRTFWVPPQPLVGSDTYIAPEPTHVAKRYDRYVSSIVRLGEVPSQKRFRLHATPLPPLTGVVVGGSLETRTLKLRTFLNKIPFAHGFQTGDAVLLSTCDGDARVISDATGEEVIAPQTAASLPRVCTCIVLESDSKEACQYPSPFLVQRSYRHWHIGATRLLGRTVEHDLCKTSKCSRTSWDFLARASCGDWMEVSSTPKEDGFLR